MVPSESDPASADYHRVARAARALPCTPGACLGRHCLMAAYGTDLTYRTSMVDVCCRVGKLNLGEAPARDRCPPPSPLRPLSCATIEHPRDDHRLAAGRRLDERAFQPRLAGTIRNERLPGGLRPLPAPSEFRNLCLFDSRHRHSGDPEIHGAKEVPVGEIEGLPIRTAEGEVGCLRLAVDDAPELLALRI
jgi:hypothetical protein